MSGVSACPANINLSWVWHEKSSLEWGVRLPPGLGSLPTAVLVFVMSKRSILWLEEIKMRFFFF